MPGPGYTSPSSKRGKNMVEEFARTMYDKGNLSRRATKRELRRALKRRGKIELTKRP